MGPGNKLPLWVGKVYLTCIILIALEERVCGKPDLDITPDDVSVEFTNVSLHCEYNLSPQETFEQLFWHYGGTLIYVFTNGGQTDGPQPGWEQRLTDVEVNVERHIMILDGSWCDSDTFRCSVFKIGALEPEVVTGKISVDQTLTSFLTNDTDSDVSCYSNTVSFNCSAYWNSDQVAVSLKNSSGYIIDSADGKQIDDMCTHLAELITEVEFNVLPGNTEMFQCEIKFDGSLITTLNNTVRFCSRRPENVINLKVEGFCTSHFVTLHWVPGYNGGETQNFVLTYQKETELSPSQSLIEIPDKNGSEIQYTVTDLEPSATYKFEVKAINSIGESDSESISGFTIALPAVTYKKATLESDVMTITWTFSADDQCSECESCYVGVAVRFKVEEGEFQKHPQNGSVNAEDGQIIIDGNFDTNKHHIVIIMVYEGDLDDPSWEDDSIEVEIVIGGMSTETIVGIVFGGAALVLLVGVAVVFGLKKYGKGHNASRGPQGELDKTNNDDPSQASSELPQRNSAAAGEKIHRGVSNLYM